MRNTTIPALAICYLAIIVSCGCKPNHRYITDGNIKLSATFRNGQPIYRNLHIGNGGSPFYSRTDDYGDIEIKLPGGEFIRLRDIDVKYLKKHANVIEDISQPGYGNWSTGERIIIGSTTFCVHDDRILEMYATAVGIDDELQLPKFRTHLSGKVISMPFKHEDIISLFGDPQEVKDVWHQ